MQMKTAAGEQQLSNGINKSYRSNSKNGNSSGNHLNEKDQENRRNGNDDEDGSVSKLQKKKKAKNKKKDDYFSKGFEDPGQDISTKSGEVGGAKAGEIKGEQRVAGPEPGQIGDQDGQQEATDLSEKQPEPDDLEHQRGSDRDQASEADQAESQDNENASAKAEAAPPLDSPRSTPVPGKPTPVPVSPTSHGEDQEIDAKQAAESQVPSKQSFQKKRNLHVETNTQSNFPPSARQSPGSKSPNPGADLNQAKPKGKSSAASPAQSGAKGASSPGAGKVSPSGRPLNHSPRRQPEGTERLHRQKQKSPPINQDLKFLTGFGKQDSPPKNRLGKQRGDRSGGGKQGSPTEVETENLERPEYQNLSQHEIDMLPQILNDALLRFSFLQQNPNLEKMVGEGGFPGLGWPYDGLGGVYKTEKERYKEQLLYTQKYEKQMKYDIYRQSKRTDQNWQGADAVEDRVNYDVGTERLQLPEHIQKKQPILHQKVLTMQPGGKEDVNGESVAKRKKRLMNALHRSMDTSKVNLKTNLSYAPHQHAPVVNQTGGAGGKEQRKSERTNSASKEREIRVPPEIRSPGHRVPVKENLANTPKQTRAGDMNETGKRDDPLRLESVQVEANGGDRQYFGAKNQSFLSQINEHRGSNMNNQTTTVISESEKSPVPRRDGPILQPRFKPYQTFQRQVMGDTEDDSPVHASEIEHEGIQASPAGQSLTITHRPLDPAGGVPRAYGNFNQRIEKSKESNPFFPPLFSGKKDVKIYRPLNQSLQLNPGTLAKERLLENLSPNERQKIAPFLSPQYDKKNKSRNDLSPTQSSYLLRLPNNSSPFKPILAVEKSLPANFSNFSSMNPKMTALQSAVGLPPSPSINHVQNSLSPSTSLANGSQQMPVLSPNQSGSKGLLSNLPNIQFQRRGFNIGSRTVLNTEQSLNNILSPSFQNNLQNQTISLKHKLKEFKRQEAANNEQKRKRESLALMSLQTQSIKKFIRDMVGEGKDVEEYWPKIIPSEHYRPPNAVCLTAAELRQHEMMLRGEHSKQSLNNLNSPQNEELDDEKPKIHKKLKLFGNRPLIRNPSINKSSQFQHAKRILNIKSILDKVSVSAFAMGQAHGLSPGARNQRDSPSPSKVETMRHSPLDYPPSPDYHPPPAKRGGRKQGMAAKKTERIPTDFNIKHIGDQTGKKVSDRYVVSYDVHGSSLNQEEQNDSTNNLSDEAESQRYREVDADGEQGRLCVLSSPHGMKENLKPSVLIATSGSNSVQFVTAAHSISSLQSRHAEYDSAQKRNPAKLKIRIEDERRSREKREILISKTSLSGKAHNQKNSRLAKQNKDLNLDLASALNQSGSSREGGNPDTYKSSFRNLFIDQHNPQNLKLPIMQKIVKIPPLEEIANNTVISFNKKSQMNLEGKYRQVVTRNLSNMSGASDFSKKMSGMNMNEIHLFRRTKNDVIAQTMTPWVDQNRSKEPLNSKSNQSLSNSLESPGNMGRDPKFTSFANQDSNLKDGQQIQTNISSSAMRKRESNQQQRNQIKNENQKRKSGANQRQTVQPDLRARALANKKLPTMVSSSGERTNVLERPPISWSPPAKLITKELGSPHERDGERSLEQYVQQVQEDEIALREEESQHHTRGRQRDQRQHGGHLRVRDSIVDSYPLDDSPGQMSAGTDANADHIQKIDSRTSNNVSSANLPSPASETKLAQNNAQQNEESIDVSMKLSIVKQFRGALLNQSADSQNGSSRALAVPPSGGRRREDAGNAHALAPEITEQDQSQEQSAVSVRNDRDDPRRQPKQAEELLRPKKPDEDTKDASQAKTGDQMQDDSAAGRLSPVAQEDSPQLQLPYQPAEASKESDGDESASAASASPSGPGAAAESLPVSPTIAPRARRFLLGDDIEPIREDQNGLESSHSSSASAEGNRDVSPSRPAEHSDSAATVKKESKSEGESKGEPKSVVVKGGSLASKVVQEEPAKDSDDDSGSSYDVYDGRVTPSEAGRSRRHGDGDEDGSEGGGRGREEKPKDPVQYQLPLYLRSDISIKHLKESQKQRPRFDLPKPRKGFGDAGYDPTAALKTSTQIQVEQDQKMNADALRLVKRKEKEKQDIIDGIVANMKKAGPDSQPPSPDKREEDARARRTKQLMRSLSLMAGPRRHISLNLLNVQQQIAQFNKDKHWGNDQFQAGIPGEEPPRPPGAGRK